MNLIKNKKESVLKFAVCGSKEIKLNLFCRESLIVMKNGYYTKIVKDIING